MCRCTPNMRTPWCGKPGCEMPEQKPRPNTFELKVSKAGMPDCPLCGKPVQEGDRRMVFRAHGLAALAHDACRPEGE